MKKVKRLFFAVLVALATFAASPAQAQDSVGKCPQTLPGPDGT